MVWTRPAACLALPACVELAALACHFDLPTRDSMAKRDFLAVTDLTRDEILRLLDLARRMKAGSSRDPPLAGNTLPLIFPHASTPPRVSFEASRDHHAGDAL